MGWETRGGHRYFYQKKRENGKVVSKYLGNGLAAEICEGADSLLATWRELQKLEGQEQEDIDTAVDAFCRISRTAINGALYAVGYHRHKGQWRKRRMSKNLIEPTNVKAAVLADIQQKARFFSLSYELYEQGENPPAEKVKELRAILESVPDLWRHYGDLVKNETEALIRQAGRNDPGWQESVKLACTNKRLNLGYDEASPLIQMAIDEVVLAWVRLYEVQNRHTYFCHDQDGKGIHPDTVEFWDRL